MKVHLTADAVREAARKAYAANQLQAQHPVYHTKVCQYSFNCAIGAALTEEQARFLDAQSLTGIGDLIKLEIVTTDSPNWLTQLQAAHDNWSQRLEVDAEKEFVSILNL